MLTRLLDAAKAGRGGALVLTGEPGIGKTALLTQVLCPMEGIRIVSAVGAEFEAEFAFGLLHQVCAPLLDGLDRLPPRQREALGVAFGYRSGEVPGHHDLGLAVLGLLSAAAESEPLVCVIDDAHWSDRMSVRVLAFVAGRIEAEPIALVLASRRADGSGGPDVPVELSALEQLPLEGLSEPDAYALLSAGLPVPLDKPVRELILAEARGNPLALIELPRGAGTHRLAGGFAVPSVVPSVVPLSGRIEQSFRDRLERLPQDTRTLLLVAAAEPTGEPLLVARAAALLGVDIAAAGPARAADLIEVEAQFRFRHGLVRSAVYNSAPLEARRAVHRALAEATDPLAAPDRKVWHRAQAVAAPRESVAAELERSADRAHARAGLPAAAAFLERAAALTPDPAERVRRLLAAAHAHQEAGAFEVASDLLDAAENGPMATQQRARADLLRGRIAYGRQHAEEASHFLLRAARRIELLSPSQARTHYLEALQAGLIAGRGTSAMRAALAAARTAPPAPAEPAPADRLLDAVLVLLGDGGHEEAAPALARLLAHPCDPLWLSWPALGMLLSVEMWDAGAFFEMVGCQVQAARASGALALLPIATAMAGVVAAHTGDLDKARAMSSESELLAEVTGVRPFCYPRLHIAALGGRSEDASYVKTIMSETEQRGGSRVMALAQWATAVLGNGHAAYASALTAARAATEGDEFGIGSLAMVELVEAAVRCNEPATAAWAAEVLARRVRAFPAGWGPGVAAYATALVTKGQDAEAYYQEAVRQLDPTGVVSYRARAHLLYGEWLRREGRRTEARRELRTALDIFTCMGAQAFADRAAAELSATGEHPRRRVDESTDQLTAQELNVARLAQAGNTSKEIGARLFLSPRTIDSHLRSIFRKLGISSRRELRSLPSDLLITPPSATR